MKLFLAKFFLFASLVMLMVTLLVGRYGGYVDYFYVKFTSPKQHSLILGDSRSMQGIRPAIIHQNVKSGFDLPILNYSFSLGQISYGPAYLKSIQRKLDDKTKNGLFIVAVSPWTLSKRPKDDEKNNIYFEENEPPHNMLFVNMNPNFEYIIRNFSFFHFKAIFKKITKTHSDGWLEEQIDTHPESIKQSTAIQANDMKLKAKEWKVSKYRVKSLENTIEYLSKFGKVYVVRMPISPDMANIETDYWPNFDQAMQMASGKFHAPYLNFAKSTDFKTFDGNHLDSESQIKFTKALCDSINKQRSP